MKFLEALKILLKAAKSEHENITDQLIVLMRPLGCSIKKHKSAKLYRKACLDRFYNSIVSCSNYIAYIAKL